ncbi:hypothetical protein D3C84_350370 [compost metagenome]
MDQRAAQAQLLFHAAGQLACRALGELQQVGGEQQIVHALLAVGFRQAEQRGKELDVFADRQLGIQVAAQALGHEGDARIQRVAVAALLDRPAEDVQLPLLQGLHAGDQPEQAGLARAIGADQPATGAGWQAEGDSAQCLLFAVAVRDSVRLNREAVHCRLAGQAIGAVRT